MKFKVLFVLLLFVYSLFLFLVADSSLGHNVILLTRSLNRHVYAITPQGWGFFTRNPREPLIDLYSINGKHYNRLSLPNSSLKYFWGFNRGMRFSSSQTAYFVSQIPDSKWMLDSDYDIDMLAQTIATVDVMNDFSYPLYCGKFLLVKTERIPWAWSKHRERLKMPRSVVVINVQCRE